MNSRDEKTTYLSTFWPKGNPFLITHAVSGFVGGAVTGAAITVPEVMKIRLQKGQRLPPILGVNSALLLEAAKMVPHFSLFFGSVCALEFSVIEYGKAKIKKEALERGTPPKRAELFAKGCGTILAAFAGAAFLTPAEHLIYRASLLSKMHQPASVVAAYESICSGGHAKLWVGFWSMFTRESLFLLNIFGFGPWLGSQYFSMYAEKDRTPTKLEKDVFEWFGTSTMGIIITTISHPFDTLARRMQQNLPAAHLLAEKAHFENPVENPRALPVPIFTSVTHSFKDLVRKEARFESTVTTFRELGLMKGVVPRIFLAPFGGFAAKKIYEFVEEQLDPSLRSPL